MQVISLRHAGLVPINFLSLLLCPECHAQIKNNNNDKNGVRSFKKNGKSTAVLLRKKKEAEERKKRKEKRKSIFPVSAKTSKRILFIREK